MLGFVFRIRRLSLSKLLKLEGDIFCSTQSGVRNSPRGFPESHERLLGGAALASDKAHMDAYYCVPVRKWMVRMYVKS